ncbi:transmembrane protein [Thalictrum thalictroides]|uniref:Transmembrane protein n=1 Tax=Thalictrum thalictroides TaxID=46969 RepID=A0A7J6VSN4_THATH|nr:transmembrane protein [Thalictrum thalictroides]
MVGFAVLLLSPIPSISKPFLTLFSNSINTPSFCAKTPIQNLKISRKFVVFAEGENGISSKDSKETNNGFNDQEDMKKDQQLPIINFSWKDLLNPDPENLVAVGLTGVLTWASVQVLWQLFFIAFAIVLAALKYSFIAALLLFILITLL